MESAGKLVEDEELREAMREKGLGTPATRAQVIEGLIYEKYVLRQGRDLIATAKASLVVLFFMHLHEQRGAPRAYLLLSLGFLLLLLGGVLADGLTRFRAALPSGQEALPAGADEGGTR